MTEQNIDIKYWENCTLLLQANNSFYIIADTFTLEKPIFRLGVGYNHQTIATMIPINASMYFLNGLLSDAICKRDNDLIDRLTVVIKKMNVELNSHNK